MQTPQNAINFSRSDYQRDQETAAESASQSAGSFDGVRPARTLQSPPLDAIDNTDSIAEKQTTLANVRKQGTFPAHAQATTKTPSNGDYAAVPSKRKRNSVTVPEIISDTSASLSSSSSLPSDQEDQRQNREPLSYQRAQFRRAVEKFVSIQGEPRHLEQDEEQDEEQPEELVEEQHKKQGPQNSRDHPSAVDRRHVRPMTRLRPQAPIQDVTYAESDAEQSPERHTLCDTELPPTQANTEKMHNTHNTLSDSSESQQTSRPNTSQRIADDDNNHANDKACDGNGVDAPTIDLAVEGLELGLMANASVLKQDLAMEQKSRAANNPTKDYGRIKIDLDALEARILTTASSSSDTTLPTSPPSSKQDAIDSASFQEEDASRASHALERVMQKSDFVNMRIVGQFNLGFIITRREIYNENGQVAMDDLFIIDQHAADEKFNFETLQRDTQIHSQTLLHPQNLELAPSDELVAASHADCLKKNGFEIQVNEDRPPGRRIGLRSKPMSKSVIFDVHDFEELLFKLREASDHTRIRCSKVRDMFASRACRKSIMVGSALNLHQMRRVVNHMGELEQPWNCPHGRPTMRHLTSLTRNSTAPWHLPQVDWSKLCSTYPS